MIVNQNHTHVRTNPVRLGRIHLYQPHAFKGDGKDAGEQGSSKPKYDIVLSFDKKTQRDDIKANLAAQKAAVQKAVDSGEWDSQLGGVYAFKDADKAKVQASMTDKRKVLLADKRPELKGHFSLKASAKASRRPVVKYLDKDGVIRTLPQPILDPDENDEAQVREAERIRDLWDSLVYPGQNAIVSYTYRAWVMPSGGQGTSAMLDNVLILGGGAPLGQTPFEEDFDADTLAEINEWASKHLHADEETVDSETGEIEESESEPEPELEPEEQVEEPAKPARRTSRRKVKPAPEPETEPDDFDEEDVDLF